MSLGHEVGEYYKKTEKEKNNLLRGKQGRSQGGSNFSVEPWVMNRYGKSSIRGGQVLETQRYTKMHSMNKIAIRSWKSNEYKLINFR